MDPLSYPSEEFLESIIASLDSDDTFEDLYDVGVMLEGLTFGSKEKIAVGRYILSALEPMFGPPECAACGGEGVVYSTEAVFDMREQQYFPEEVPHQCRKCGGSGVEPWA